METEIDGENDEAFDVAFETQQQARQACEEYDSEVENILSGLSLPLSDSLKVSPEEVPARSQEILEQLVRLGEERDKTLQTVEKTVEEFLSRVPEGEREETRAKIDAIGMFS